MSVEKRLKYAVAAAEKICSKLKGRAEIKVFEFGDTIKEIEVD